MIVPSREEFRRRAERGNLIPVYREVIADMETPVSAFRKLGGGRYAFLLESVEGGENLGRYSFLGTEPFLTFRSKGRSVIVEEGHKAQRMELGPGQDPLHLLKRIMSRYRFVGGPGLPPFVGGAVGYMGYDLVRFFETLPEQTEDDLNLPDTYFQFTDTLLAFDHVRHRLQIINNALVDNDPDAAFEMAVAKIDAVIDRLRTTAVPWSPHRPGRAEATVLQSNMTPVEFEDGVRQAKEYIGAGDIIQAVLSQRFETEIQADAFDVYRALRSVNPSPYLFFLAFGDLKLAGSSPEVHVTASGGRARLRPIAGTRRRGADAEEDAALAEELLADEKERAEHVMLVDLGRNDLGRVCRYGSVQVDELMVIERYSHVMHIVSNVAGELLPDRDAFDVLRATFPAGTVSGAPKIRAMEIIEELEHTRRGPYAGAIGYFSYSGSMDTCIAIRTVVMRGQRASVQAGAGIVADSVPEREHQECVSKAAALAEAIAMAERGLE